MKLSSKCLMTFSVSLVIACLLIVFYEKFRALSCIFHLSYLALHVKLISVFVVCVCLEIILTFMFSLSMA